MIRAQKGFGLVEMMVALLISLLVAYGITTVLIDEARVTQQMTGKDRSSQEASMGFDIVADLISQAEICLYSCATVQQISISYPVGPTNPNPAGSLSQASDSIQIDFTIPSGFNIWPNNVVPYTNNAIRINWLQSNGLVTLSAGASVSDAAGVRTPIVIAGSSDNMGYKIANLDLWPMSSASGNITVAGAIGDKPVGGYVLSMTTRSPTKDTSYTNPKDNGLLKNYRTVTISKSIIPRNW